MDHFFTNSAVLNAYTLLMYLIKPNSYSYTLVTIVQLWLMSIVDYLFCF